MVKTDKEKYFREPVEEAVPEVVTILEVTDDVIYKRGELYPYKGGTVINFKQQAISCQNEPPLRVFIRDDMDRKTLLSSLRDLQTFINAMFEDSYLSKSGSYPPTGAYTLVSPMEDIGWLVSYELSYFCDCAGNNQLCPCNSGEQGSEDRVDRIISKSW